MNKRKILAVTLVGVAAFIGIFTQIKRAVEEQKTVLINEVCSSNTRIINDGIHDGSDYLELYNRSEEVVCLSGWYLSDDEADTLKYELPECYIYPGEYLTLYADGEEDEVLLPFGLNYGGEKLFLSDPDGNLMDSIMVPGLDVDVTYARMTDGINEWAVKEPTPGESNDDAKELVVASLDAPEFSAGTGFYEEAFYLTLSAGRGETIYYTLDGSVPDEDSFVYEEPIFIENRSEEPNQHISHLKIVEEWRHYEPITEPVDKAMVVRAIAMNEDGEISEVITETYFVNLAEYDDQTVISLVVDPEELFGDKGIFATGPEYDYWYENNKQGEKPETNFMMRGKAWEVVADMDMLIDSELVMSQYVGMRTQGNSGRRQELKRLSLFAREEYSGSDYFDDWLFDKEQVHSLMINEFVSNVALPRLVESRDVGIQQSRVEPAAVFINGEYWYTRYMMEKYNRHYLAGTFGVNPDNVVLFKNNEVHTGDPDYEEDFREVQEIAMDDELTPDEKYDQLCELIDMQSFIDFFSINAYLCNMNMTEEENYLLWKTIEPEEGNEYADTKWRWLIYDVECVESLRLEFYAATERASINSFAHPMDWIYVCMNENSIFSGLKECQRFQDQFIASFLEIANENFDVTTVELLLEEYDYTIDWMESFFLKRKDYMLQYLAEEFELENLNTYM